MSGTPRSLAEAASQETVTVRRILFGCLQTRCAELGVDVGNRLEVVDRQGAALVLRTAGGRLVTCPPEVARFVEVEGAQTTR